MDQQLQHNPFDLGPPGGGGVPLKYHLAPYLAVSYLLHQLFDKFQCIPFQMDPSTFIDSTPQYIVPEEGGSGSRGFTKSMHFVGSAVAAGYAIGSAKGTFAELFNSQTRRLVSFHSSFEISSLTLPNRFRPDVRG